MAYRIKFYGKDYSPIDECIKNYPPTALKDNGDSWALEEEELITILLRFLQNSQEKSSELVINGKTNKTYELFSLHDGKFFFGGVVGVLTGKLKMDLSEIRNDDTSPFEEYEMDITLQIQSRFDVNSSGIQGKPFFLSAMISDDIPELNSDFVSSNPEDFLFDFLLLFSFKSKLKDAYLKGYYRTYHRFEKNDDRIKGSIDISRHIRENAGLNNGKIAYSYRENSTNNYLNHLIVSSYFCLKKKYFSLVCSVFDSDFDLKCIIDNLKMTIGFPKYDTKTLIMRNLNAIVHPFYTEYEELRRICLKIMRNEGVSIFDGNSADTVYGILFYIPDLWEKYLEKFLMAKEYGFSPQRKINIIDYAQDRVYKQETCPDYVFYMDKSNKEPFMILDAKFKEKWGDAVFNKRAFSSFLEDYDKCIRDMNSICSHAAGVIFPTNNSNAMNPKDYIVHSISEYNIIDRFYTFPVFVPDSSNNTYRNWRCEFDRYCKEISALIKDKIKAEKDFKNRIDTYQNNIASFR